jgi:hypothetical protein
MSLLSTVFRGRCAGLQARGDSQFTIDPALKLAGAYGPQVEAPALGFQSEQRRAELHRDGVGIRTGPAGAAGVPEGRILHGLDAASE